MTKILSLVCYLFLLIILGTGCRTTFSSADGSIHTIEAESEGDSLLGSDPKLFKRPGTLGLSFDHYRYLTENIAFLVERGDPKFITGDDLTLGLYILRYLAEIGRYRLNEKDIETMVTVYTTLMKKPIDPKVITILQQTKRLEFDKKNNSYSVRFYSKNGGDIILHINEKNSNPEHSLEEMKSVHIQNGASMTFVEANDPRSKADLEKFITKKQKIFGLPIMESTLNSIHPAIKGEIKTYLAQVKEVQPLLISGNGFYAKVKRRGKGVMDISLERMAALPLMSNKSGRLPGVVLQVKAGMASIKTSIDQ